MNVALVSIDSKYIHTNMALRYLKANLSMESSLIEFTIKDDVSMIEASILSNSPDIIAFSVYLWNVEIIMRLVDSIKMKSPSIIVLGGPEVSFEPKYFMEKSMIDYIVCGEGEVAFNSLVNAIQFNLPVNIIPGLVYRSNEKIIQNAQNVIKDLNQIKNPYHFENDISKLGNRIQYIEMSRGCPFHCSYCLASLDNNVRFFDVERVQSDIRYLMENGAKTFKFLDRTFNYKIDHALAIFDFIIKNHVQGTQFQFEITGDLLPISLITYVNEHAPKGLFRFEIGIQSTNQETNLSVDRLQNNEKLFKNIRLIQESGVIDLHLDLIAGLPLEDLTRFSKTFDEVFNLYPKELQLGFLKMLRGTKIRRESEKYGYIYDRLPPYEMRSNHYLSEADIKEIHFVEEVLETFWNKGFMSNTFRKIIERENSAFQFMGEFAHYLIDFGFDFHRYQLSDLFMNLATYLEITHRNQANIIDYLKREYLERSKIKPHIWWNETITRSDKAVLFNKLIKEYPTISIDDFYKYSVVTTYEDHFLIILYFPTHHITIEY